MPFQVGDRVVVTSGTYRITVPGSYGVITHVRGSELYDITFEHLPNGDDLCGYEYVISGKYLDYYAEGDQAIQIEKTIQKLHHRQQFYLEHKHELPSWG